MNKNDDRRLRRRAVEIVAMLPDEPAQARLVLAYAQEVLSSFVHGVNEAGQTEQFVKATSKPPPGTH